MLNVATNVAALAAGNGVVPAHLLTMSLESLGSLARTVSDRFLRENLRRLITGTNSSISSVLDGTFMMLVYSLF